MYFLEATGYHGVDAGNVLGIWGPKIESFFFIKLRLRNLWPISEHIDTYDEVTLFSVIEFLHDYVSEPIDAKYHDYNQCGWHANIYNKAKGQAKYRDEINEILKDYGCGFQLSTTGEVTEIPPTGLESLITCTVTTKEPKAVEDRVKLAVDKYLRYSATLDDKKDAVRTLADVLEFLKKEGIKLPEKDDSDLSRIINGFDVRHHSREQQGQYDKEIWYDWIFYTFLSSIYALLKLKAT